MDLQRSKKKGKPNYFVVIPITQPTILSNLQMVLDDLERRYSSSRSDLRKACVDLNSNKLHITLFGMHGNKQRIQQVRRALKRYEEHKNNCSENNGGFEIEIKGLGSWQTKKGNIILFGDITQNGKERIKQLAKEIRDFVVCAIDDEERENVEDEEDFTGEERDEEDAQLVENIEEKENQENQDKEDFDEDQGEKEENEEEEENENEGSENGGLEGDFPGTPNSDLGGNEVVDEEDYQEDFSGLWLDDPRPDIYLPHLTLMSSDPKWDKKLRTQIYEKDGISKKSKRGGYESKRENFGQSYALLRDVRNVFSKMTFGVQKVEHVELQSMYECLEKLYFSK